MNTMELLSSLVGKLIRIDRGGPESRSGRLIAVKPDHLILSSEGEGTIYYTIEHIKSISIVKNDTHVTDVKQSSESVPQERLTLEVAPLETEPEEISTTHAYLDYDNFLSVVKKMRYQIVQINRGGPEKLVGLLTVATDDCIMLVVNNELVTIFNFHVRNISYANTQNNNEKSDNSNKNEKKNDENKNKEKEKNKKKKKK